MLDASQAKVIAAVRYQCWPRPNIELGRALSTRQGLGAVVNVAADSQSRYMAWPVPQPLSAAMAAAG